MIQDPTQGLRLEMGKYGLDPGGDIKWDGRIHRFPGKGKKKSNRSGWYRAFDDHKGAAFGDFSSMGDDKKHWMADRSSEPTGEERERWRAAERERKKQREKEIATATKAVQAVWENAIEAQASVLKHPYLERKGIESAEGLKVSCETDISAITGKEGDVFPAGLLLVPMRRGKELVDLQRIWPGGRKMFFPGADPKGCVCVVGGKLFKTENPRVYICEGWADARTISQATQCCAIVAFTAHALSEIAALVRRKYPEAEIVVAADNDRWSTISAPEGHPDIPNPGVYYAKVAEEEVEGVRVAIPQFTDLSKKPTDFDDLRMQEGMKQVRWWLDPDNAGEAVTEPHATGEEDIETEPADEADDDGRDDEAAEQEMLAKWFAGLPPADSKGDVARAITVAIESGLAADIGISSTGTIMFHHQGTWYPPETKGGISRVAVATHYAESGLGLRPIREAFQVLAGRVQVNASPIAFDSNPDIVGLPAKPGEWREVLDFGDGNGTVRRARRDDFVTRSIGAKPRLMPIPIFKAALQRWACGDAKRVKMLRRILVSCLIGRQPERALFFMLGPKASGKSMFAALVQMLGRDYIGSLQPSDIGVGKGQKADELIYGHLEGYRGMFAPELPSGSLRANFLKAVCGGDAVQVRRLYQDPWNYVPTVTLILITNALPGVNVLDPALKDRIRVIQFPESIRKQDWIPKANLLAELRHELPGILNNLIPDAGELLDAGMTFNLDDFAREDREAVETWALEADEMRGFCDLLVLDPKGRIPNDELRNRFQAHLQETGEETDTWHPSKLSRALNKRGFGSAGKVGGQRCRIGVRWKNP